MKSKFKEKGIDEITCFEDYFVDTIFELEKTKESLRTEITPPVQDKKDNKQNKDER
jgi:hypothetical protein